MRRSLAIFLVLLLLVPCLVLIAMEAASPLLYSKNSSPPTPDQVNPASLEPLTGGKPQQILPLMNDLLDAPGTLILDLRSGDFEEAGRDLREMHDLTQSLDSLVINLDMTEGELAEFRRANQKNLQILTDLFNGTERWDELRSLEVRFRDSDDPRALTSITYEGEALRQRIRELYQEYQEESGILLPASEKFELDTAQYEASQAEFGEIVRELNDEQETRIQNLQTRTTPVEPPFRLTLEMDRKFAFYMSTITFQGALSGEPPGSPRIDLFIDTEKVASVPAAGGGNYRYTYLVERLPSGTHTVFAVYADSAYSGIQTFRIEEMPSDLSLDPPELGDGSVILSGRLMAGTLPVRDAEVEILSEGRRTSLATTDEQGRFRIQVRLAPGPHRIQAFFDHGSFPLSSAWSGAYPITVPGPSPFTSPEPGFPLDLPQLLSTGAVLGCAFLAAVAYLRYRRAGARSRKGIPGPVASGSHDLSVSPDFVPPPATDPGAEGEAVLSRYLEIAETDLREAAFTLYSYLRRALASRLALPHPSSLTPRELCSRAEKMPFSSRLCVFLRKYEEVRYGEARQKSEDAGELADSFYSLLKDTGGDRS